MVAPVLDEMQFELDGYVFGLHKSISVDAEGFDPGDPDKITQDGVNPITGARVFGRDMQGAGSWTFACHLDETDTETALASAAEMGSKWRDEKWHTTVAMLRYHVGGRTRCVFGRPRRFSFKPGNLILQGYLPPLATFDLSDAKHYDDDELFVDLQTSPTLPGGFAVPFEAPILIELPANQPPAGGVVVGGDTSTSMVVEFTGPLTDGSVKIGDDFVAGFVGTLGAEKKLTIDARPWSLSVVRSSGVNVQLSAATRINKATLKPGSYQAILTGSDETGTAQCRVSWRNAYSTL